MWWNSSQSVSSIPQLCPTLCNTMGCSPSGFPVHHQLPELAQTPVHRVGDAIQPSHPLSSPSPPAFNLSQQSGSFPMSLLFPLGGQSIGASASALVLPMNIQGWFPLGLTGLISLQSKGVSSLLQHYNLKASILGYSAFFMVQLSHPYKTTGKAIALTIYGPLPAKWSLCFLIHCLGPSQLSFQGASVF